MDLTRKQKKWLWVLGVVGFIGVLGGVNDLLRGRPGGIESGLISIIFWPIIFVLVYWRMKRTNQDKKQFAEAGGIDIVFIGNYLIGLPHVNLRVEGVKCAIYPDYFVFMDGKREIDTIPRDSINQIMVDSKSQITQRLTATRMLALGVFSLAAPKKQRSQEFCLVIDWDDFNGVKQNTVFEFLESNGSALANQAANTLKRYVKAKVERLKANEKKCPYCAEIIKREAKICKHCHSQLEQ
jgi:hypothetical protein